VSEAWFDIPLAVVDVETTGLDPATDRVIEIAIVHMCRGELESRWSSLVNPEREVPPEILKITGIDLGPIQAAAPFREVAAQVRARLEGRAFVAYNLPFDRAFLKGELARAGIAWDPAVTIDPLVFARELQKDAGSKRLGAVAERLGIELKEAHRALADAEVAGRVLYALAPSLPPGLEDLRVLEGQWATLHHNEMAGWRKGERPAIDEAVGGPPTRGNALGPAYLYGEETDPVRFMFLHLPDSGGKR
jgi:DNA polymerase-3 subunit epsilon